MSEPTHYKQKQEKSGDTIAENKHRKDEKQKTIFSFPQKISRNEMERAILGGGRSFQFNGRTLRVQNAPKQSKKYQKKYFLNFCKQGEVP